MISSFRKITLNILSLLLLSGLISTVSAHPDDIYWESGFEPPRAIEGTWMYSLIKYQDKIIIGGDIQAAGSIVTPNIVAWDGTEFSSLGNGLPSAVSALVEYNGELIAAAGGGVAAWNGSSWTALSPNVIGWISTMVVWNDKLCVGGDFDSIAGVPSRNIAVWDGSTWAPAGTGTSTASQWVIDLCVFDNKLIAAGNFDSAGGILVNNIAAWDGNAWSALGNGVKGDVRSVIAFQSSLVAAGVFDSANGVAAKKIAQWDGNIWSAMGQGANKNIYFIDTLGNELIASGIFDTIDGIAARRIALFDGLEWKPIDTGLTQPAYAFLEDSGRLIIGGRFTAAQPLIEHSLATWDSTNGWKPVLGGGMDEPVYDFCLFDEKVITGGAFRKAGKQAFAKIAAWDGNSWTAIGNGINFIDHWEWVLATAEYDSKLIVAGNFLTIDGINAPGIAMWDDSSWSPLADGSPYVNINSLQVYDNKLVACGSFQILNGSDTIRVVAAWDGSSWSSLGDFTLEDDIGSVYDLEIFNGQLIAIGWFDSVNGVAATNIAAWDGNSWSSIGSGVGDQWGSVTSAGVFNNELVVGGFFTTAGGVSVNHIAKWNGVSWSPLGDGVVGPLHGERVGAMTVYDNKLIVGGTFETAGGVTVNNIAAWDGSAWSNLGSGISEPIELFLNGNIFGGARVYALQVFDDKLLVGGDFTGAGGKLSCGFAVWNKGVSTGTGDDPHSELPNGYQLSQNYPNPFNPSTQIKYELPTKSQVTVTVYNLLGQKVRSLVNEIQSAGSHIIEWDGRDDAGKRTATGMYMYRIEAGNFKQTKKMILLK